MKKMIVAFGLSVITVATVALGQSANQNSTNVPLPPSANTLGQTAQVDWTQGLLIVRGVGIATKGSVAQKEVKALAAARADAQRILLSALQGVQLSSSTSVKNFELQNDQIKTQVEGVLKNAFPIEGSEKLEPKSDGSLLARISYAIPLYGENSLLAALLPTMAVNGQTKPPRVAELTVAPSPAPKPAGVVAPPPTTPTTPSTTSPNTGSDLLPTYTGLIVDARGKKYVPCMSPKILVGNGAEVWGTVSVSSSFANNFGIASFVRRPEDATRLGNRGGPGQLTVKALKATGLGGYNCDAVISDADAALVQRAEARYGFLKDFKVTFVY